MVVIDTDERLLAPWRAMGITCLAGHPIQQDLLTAALPNASWLLITLDDSLLAGEIAIRAQEYGALMRIAACAHQHEEVHHLRVRGVHQVVKSEGGGCAATLSPRHGDGLKLIGSHESPTGPDKQPGPAARAFA